MEKLKHIKGIVFDWAGTLVDYGCLAPTAVFVEVFKKNGIAITMEEARGPMGLAKKDHIRELFKLGCVASQWEKIHGAAPTEQEVEQLYAQLTPVLIEIIPKYCKAIPGVKDLYEFLKNSNIKIGSTTGYVSEMMEPVILAAIKQGILPDSVITSDEIPLGRPAPFMVYKNAIKLAIFPMKAMVKVGDTIADVKEGINAGMWVVAYTKCGNELGYSEEDIAKLPDTELNEKLTKAEEKLRAAGAHFVVEGPWELPNALKEIDELIGKNIVPANINSLV
ncbi:phosphonoacetaldehyde hydrolase [Marinifilum sp.]|uniref:phosphonoacetaldehyde hydrolase n=1 Tax=Marinifilum sp. TaxID=2033137 RepID=UPI003BA87E29